MSACIYQMEVSEYGFTSEELHQQFYAYVYEQSFHYEFIHMTGKLQYRSLAEGVTELINEEFFQDEDNPCMKYKHYFLKFYVK